MGEALAILPTGGYRGWETGFTGVHSLVLEHGFLTLPKKAQPPFTHQFTEQPTFIDRPKVC